MARKKANDLSISLCEQQMGKRTEKRKRRGIVWDLLAEQE